MVHYSIFLIVIFTVVGFALRVFHLDFQSLWLDDLIVILKAEQKSLWDIFQAAKVDTHPPLYDFLIHYWMNIGRDEWTLRFFSLIFGVGSIPLIYLVGKKCYDEKVGLTAALIFTFWPVSIWYSQAVRPYTLIIFLGLAAIGFFLKGLETNKWKYWCYFIIFITFGLYTHHSALYLVFVLNIFLVISWLNKKYLNLIYQWIVIQIILILLYIPGYVILVSEIIQIENSGITNIDFVKKPGFSTIPRLFYHLTFCNDSLSIGWVGGLLLIPVIILFFSGIRPNKESWKGIPSFIIKGKTLFFILYLFLPILLSFVLGILVRKEYMYEPRFFILFVPAYLIILARGILQIKHKLAKGILSFCLIFPMLISDYMIYTHSIYPPIKKVAEYVKESYEPGDLVMFHHSLWKIGFDYYSKKSLVTEGAFYTYNPKEGCFPSNFLDITESYVPVFEKKLKDYSRLWLVLTPHEVRHDPNQIIIKHLDMHFKKFSNKKFPPYFEILLYDLKLKKQT